MPDDPFIIEMDPIQKMWMFQNWVEDHRDEMELAKDHAYLLGSFWNPEAVSKMMGSAANTYVSSDEDMESSMKMIREGDVRIAPDNVPIKRRRRRVKE